MSEEVQEPEQDEQEDETGSPLDGREDLQKLLLDRTKVVNERGRANRIGEVQAARDSRLYYRNYQQFYWSEDRQDIVLIDDDDDNEPYSRTFNVFQGYGKIFQSTFMGARPKVRPEADDPFDPVSIRNTSKAEQYERVYRKHNDTPTQQLEIARLLWTDSRVVTRTTQRGGREVTEFFGVLESRLPIAAKRDIEIPLANCNMIQLEDEFPTSTMKANYPDARDKISSGRGDTYDRNARMAVKRTTGTDTSIDVMTGEDSYGMATKTWTYLRPEFFEDLKEEERTELSDMFPDGACIVHTGDIYLESYECDLDSTLDVIFALPGDGMSGPSIGQTAMTLQDAANTGQNLIEEMFDHGIPTTYADQATNIAGLNKQREMPGQTRWYTGKAGMAGKDLFFETTPVQPSEALIEYVENVKGPQMQFATAMQPALNGAEMQDQKLMDISVPIPTPWGFVPNGDLVAGDTVFGQDGLPYKITVAHPHQIAKAYRVTFDDGTFVHVHAGHLWTTSTRKERVNAYRNGRELKGKTRTTLEIAKSLFEGKESTKMGVCLNHTIPCTKPIQTIDAESLPIDPYCFGAWLGDGYSKGGSHFTASDADGPFIMSQFEAAGYETRRLKSPNDWSVIGLTRQLDDLGVQGNKHIPEMYLWASESDRLALLQGLMDTDGNCSVNGRARFTNCNESIADGVYHLACSLGLKAFRRKEVVHLKGKRCADAYWVEWAGPLPVFRMKRKLAGLKNKYSPACAYRYITSIVEDGEMVMRCLTTDNPNGLYLFGDNFNVTHNTASGYAQARSMALGVMAIVWKPYTSWNAREMTRAVKMAAKRSDEIVAVLKSDRAGGRSEAIRLGPGDLMGVGFTNDSDENFPETFTERQNKFMGLLQMGGDISDMILQRKPENIYMLKQMTQLDGLVFPGEDIYENALEDIASLEKDPSMPDPAQMPSSQFPQPGQVPQVPQTMGIQIDNDFLEPDDYKTGYETVKDWLNSAKGKQVKQSDPGWYERVRQYGLQYKQGMIAAQNAPKPETKPMSISANWADLPPDAQQQALQQDQIQANPATIGVNKKVIPTKGA